MGNETISEQIFQAIDIITSQRLADVAYDKTLICTIEDTANAANGEYIVSDTSSSFKAYSDNTKFITGTKVYVTVPNGDMNNQKIITGKYVSEEGSSFNYVSPLNDFIDITGNIIETNTSVSLLANKGLIKNSSERTTIKKESKYYSPNFLIEAEDQSARQVELWQYSGNGITDFDRMGISVKFKTALSGLKAKGGTYGIRLDVNVSTTTTLNVASGVKQYSFYLTNEDCFGNPYNFSTYYTQEKMFDLSDILKNSDTEVGATTKTITAMRLVAFQDQDFFDENNSTLPFYEKNKVDDLGFKYEFLPDNIWIKDVYLSFGYATSDFQDGKLILGSNNGLTYGPSYTDTSNRKDLYLRWAYKTDSGKYTAIDTDAELKALNENAKVHWYRYRLADKVSNELAGSFWSEIPAKKNTVAWETTERQLKNEYAQGYYTEDTFNRKMEQARSQYASDEKWNLTLTDSFNLKGFLPDTSAQTEKFKVIIEIPNRDYVLDNLLTKNSDFDSVINYFKNIPTSHSELSDVKKAKYTTIATELRNITHDGSQEAYDQILAKYEVKDDGDGKGILWISENESYEKPSWPGSESSQDVLNKYYTDLANYNDWTLRTENKAQFDKLVTLVTSAFGAIQYYYSDILTLENESICENPADIDLIQGLQITCDPKESGGYGGIYCLYDSTGSILNSAESTKSRILTATYSSLVTGDDKLDKASQIQWRIPLNNTMIKAPVASRDYAPQNRYEKAYDRWVAAKSNTSLTSDEVTQKYNEVVAILNDYKTTYPYLTWDKNLKITSDTDLSMYRDQYKEENGYAIITRKGSENYQNIDVPGTAQQIEITQSFSIKDYYIQSATNNTIYCSIIKNNKTYEAEISLSFGTSGTNGTDATLKLEMVDTLGAPASYMPLGKELDQDSYIRVIPHLFNYNNEEISLGQKTIHYSWFSGMLLNEDKNKIAEFKQKINDAQKKLEEEQKAYNLANNDEQAEMVDKDGSLTIARAIYEKAVSDYDTWRANQTYAIQFADESASTSSKGNEGVLLKLPKNVDITECLYSILKVTVPGYEVTSKIELVIDDNGQPVINKESGEQETRRITKEINLTSYIAIPVARSSYQISYAAIPDSVVYDINGSNPAYYKSNFHIYDKENHEIKVDRWVYRIEENGNNKEYTCDTSSLDSWLQYYPTIKQTVEGFVLQPPNMYYSNSTGFKYGYEIAAQQKIGNKYVNIWMQPIYIGQNRFGSSTLNNWNGDLTIDEENGIILSAMMGAGVKNDDNSFSGVLMGDVETRAAAGDKIGLYGYDHGAQSFGFKVDGTAFLGAPGKGRINFDGNNGIISSGNFNKDKNTGMKINLNAGVNGTGEGSSIQMYGIGENGAYQGVVIDPTGDSQTTYTDSEIDPATGQPKVKKNNSTIFRIFSGNTSDGEEDLTAKKSLIEIGSNGYFLQTADYRPVNNVENNFKKGQGTKIDLKNGKIQSFDFEINAMQKESFADTEKGIRISSGGSPYIQITQSQDLFKISKDGTYFLQSNDFKENNGTYEGLRLDLNKGRLYAGNMDITATGSNGSFWISTNGNPFLRVVRNGNVGEKTVFEISNSTFYLQSYSYDGPDGFQGMKLDIDNESIYAHKFKLSTKNSNGQTITIDSDGIGTPFDINNNFKISWDGSLQITDHFSIDKDGNVQIKNGSTDSGSQVPEGVTSSDTDTGPGFLKLSNSGAICVNDKFNVDKYGNVNINGHVMLFNDGAMAIGNGISGTRTNGVTSFDYGASFFWVDQNGNMNATAGRIGGWHITKDSLYSESSGSKSLILSSSGDNRISIGTISVADDGSGNITATDTAFKVTKDGALTATNATLYSANIHGSIHASSGAIGGWTISSESIFSGSTYLYRGGRIVCNDIKITGGTLSIGSVTINSNGLTCTGNVKAAGLTVGKTAYTPHTFSGVYLKWSGTADFLTLLNKSTKLSETWVPRSVSTESSGGYVTIDGTKYAVQNSSHSHNVSGGYYQYTLSKSTTSLAHETLSMDVLASSISQTENN